MPHAAPGQEKSLRFLRKLCGTEDYGPGCSLPAIKMLAREAGVPYATMYKAVRRLCRSGYLKACRGKGLTCIRRIPSHVDDAREPVAHRKWRALSEQLNADILSGTLLAGDTLPSIKELRRIYHCSYGTIRRALDYLTGEGVLKRVSCGHTVPYSVHVAHYSCICLVTVGNPAGAFMELTPLRGEIFRFLKYETIQRGIELRIFTMPFEGGNVRFPPQLRQFLSSKDTAGTILGAIVMPLLLPAQRLAEFGSLFGRLDRPLAVIDDTGAHDFSVCMQTCRRLQVVSVSNSAFAGKAMARYLLSIGHRGAAWVSAYGDSTWSRNRRYGLEQEFLAAGLSGAVRAHEIPESAYRDAVHHETDRRSALANAAVADPAGLPPIAAETISTITFDIIRRVEHFVRHAMLQKILAPLLEKVFRDPACTAVVAANDDVGLACLDIVRVRRVCVPRDLSVVAFDDTAEAAAGQLSSYNFNVPAVVRAALAIVLKPQSAGFTGQRARGVLEIDGFINERESSGHR